MVLKWEITKGQVSENSEVQEHRDGTVTINLPGLRASLCTTYLMERYVCKTNLMKFSSLYSSHLRFYTAMQVKFLQECRLCLALVSLWKYTDRKIRSMCVGLRLINLPVCPYFQNVGYWISCCVFDYTWCVNTCVDMKLDALCYYCILGRRKAVVIRILLGWLQSCE